MSLFRTCLVCCLFLTGTVTRAAEVRLLLPQNRSAFQTNEWIDLSVVRRSAEALPAGPLTLSLTGADGSVALATFAAPALPLQGKEALGTEHLHVNGWLLRPGAYTVTAAVDGAKATATIDVFSHVRQSSFRLINWGKAKGKEQLIQGENSFGFNLFYGHYANDDEANFLRAGVDFMSNCTMSGGHQMDLRLECDWSDPTVTRGGTRRVVRRALVDRSRPNVPGVHFYDEPGLTWHKHPVTGEFGPHDVPAQVRAYRSAFGRDPLPYHQVDPKNPEHVARWKHWAVWKLGFMDAAWKEAQFGVLRVRPDFLAVTQSQYGWTAFTDGYYFNVARSLPVASGHGGYHDFGPGYFNPSQFLEMARARDHAKPCWYLPTWYADTTADQFRLEQYLSFQMNVQGMMSPPDCEPATNAGPRQGIVESNHLMKKLGPVFTTMPVTKPPVALLYSLSQAIHTQTKDRGQNYAHAIPHGKNLPLAYLAGKLIQQQVLAVVDEDVLDGTLAADHKAVVLTSLDYLDPQVVAALEDFARGGGLVLLTGDCTVAVKGAVKLPVTPRPPDQAPTGKWIEAARPLAQALRAELDRKGIKPVLESDNPAIVVTRQAAGDVEYLFAVNATYDDAARDAKGNPERNAVKATAATLSLPDDGRPVYDAVRGGPVTEFQARGGKLTGQFRFGPGQMRVFARTSRPIAQVRVATPVVQRDLVSEKEPIRVEIAASLVGTGHRLLSGSFPMHIHVLDSNFRVRHELYRATKLGQLTLSLPLAVNDPAGDWTVHVRDLLSGKIADAVTFRYTPPPAVRALAGATPRAVHVADDRDHAFRFARTFHEVTVVKGRSDFNDAAAKRLAKVLQPWGVRCKEMDLAEASKPRRLSEEEAATWVGLNYAPTGQIKPGDANPPALSGFAVQGPVILLGNPDDHPMIQFLLTEKFLPYVPNAATFPGRGRGYFAWQRDAVGAGQESVVLIAYDEVGMSEAVGSFYEAVAGMEPLTRWTWPQTGTLTPGKAILSTPGLAIAWTATLPDRVVALKADGMTVTALTHDGTRTTFSAKGEVLATRLLEGAELEKARKDLAPVAQPDAVEAAKRQTPSDRLLKFAAAQGNYVAAAFWGGTLRTLEHGQVRSEQMLPQDITALTWLNGRLVVGLADGRIYAL